MIQLFKNSVFTANEMGNNTNFVQVGLHFLSLESWRDQSIAPLTSVLTCLTRINTFRQIEWLYLENYRDYWIEQEAKLQIQESSWGEFYMAIEAVY